MLSVDHGSLQLPSGESAQFRGEYALIGREDSMNKRNTDKTTDVVKTLNFKDLTFRI